MPKGLRISNFLTVLLLALALGTTGCLRLKQRGGAAKPPPPHYMQAKGGLEVLDVPEESQPSPSFVLDGKPFCFAGSNNYYLTFKSKRMVDDVLEAASAMGLKVMRFWGFEDRGSLDGTIPNADGDGTKEGVYFQYWDSEKRQPAYNENPQTGLPRLDYVLTKARSLNLKVIVVLTNNWEDFGGMDQYLLWYGLDKHHEFYTDSRVKEAYKNWVQHLIERKNSIDGTPYRDDPAIFSWELANEPRCRNMNQFDATGWDKTTITTWADEMSRFIKSLDSNHLVSVGDEGFLASGGHWTYEATDGVDHAALLALPGVDFGTFHMYPDLWGTGLRWANGWIQDHIDVARKAGKPTVLEEYGIVVQRNQAGEIDRGWERREVAYKNWNELLLKRGGAGSMFWILSGIDDERPLYPDYDHFTVYRGDRTAQLLKPYIDRFQTDAEACTNPTPFALQPSPFVRTSRSQAVAVLDAPAILAALGGSS